MAPIESLSFPNKSHRKKVSLPEYSEKLAEFFGIMMGDGGVNNPWQANITLNAVADKNYSNYVIGLCEELFDLIPGIRKQKNKNALVITLTSTTLVDYLVENGLPRGDKLRAGLCIPKWVREKQQYRIACIRGLMDTDGCLYIHKHSVLGKRYENLGFCFTSYSPPLIKHFSEIFEEFGFMPHINRQGKNLFLYKEKEIAQYLEIFGSSNDRILSLYKRYMDSKHGGVG